MKILAIDTVHDNCSVAVFDGDVLLHSITDNKERSRSIVAMMELALVRSDIWYDNLNFVVVPKGPGSFTGLRAGITAAIAIEVACKAKPVGVCVFDMYKKLIAHTGHEEAYIIISTSRNSFAVLNVNSLVTPIELDREGLLDFLAQDKPKVITGNCQSAITSIVPEIAFVNDNTAVDIASQITFVSANRPMAELCGLTGYDMIAAGYTTSNYPLANYGTSTKIKKPSDMC